MSTPIEDCQLYEKRVIIVKNKDTTKELEISSYKKKEIKRQKTNASGVLSFNPPSFFSISYILLLHLPLLPLYFLFRQCSQGKIQMTSF